MTCRKCGQPIAWVERANAYGHTSNPAGRHHYAKPASDHGDTSTPAASGAGLDAAGTRLRRTVLAG